MWEEASILGVQSLSELTEPQFLLMLEATHEYWRQHPSQRRSRGLRENAGPQSIADRENDRQVLSPGGF